MKTYKGIALTIFVGVGVLVGISCKQTKTSTAAPPSDPLLPSSVSPPITPVKTTSSNHTETPGK